MDTAAINVIRPRYDHLNQKNFYVGDHRQGKSCPTCPAPVNPQLGTSRKALFLPDPTVFCLKSRRTKITSKKSCAAADIDVENLNNIPQQIPQKIRDAKGGRPTFFL
ncbi:hypothetical protein B9Z65_5588 [Elsinoe australis]|uniref:Uncharacterized protein n=1 Tax=Elsinoe australis TaxID=40998 RepID=A0A2P7ZJL8_9PEZI|nr:hypothetical protein B9Z65_5588 [Elsinoe australis]